MYCVFHSGFMLSTDASGRSEFNSSLKYFILRFTKYKVSGKCSVTRTTRIWSHCECHLDTTLSNMSLPRKSDSPGYKSCRRVNQD